MRTVNRVEVEGTNSSRTPPYEYVKMPVKYVRVAYAFRVKRTIPRTGGIRETPIVRSDLRAV